MAFLRVNHIKNKPYLYLVKSKWSKRKQRSVQKVIKYYGRVKDEKISSKAIFDRDQDQCQRCGAISDLTIDHKIPLNSGGDNSLENLWVLCNVCNQKKRDLDLNGEKFGEDIKLLTKLKFWIVAFENEYKRKKGENYDEKLMRKSVYQKKKIKEIIAEIKEKKIDINLKYESYL